MESKRGLIRGVVVAGAVAITLEPSVAIDHDADGMSDVWERIFEAESLLPDEDTDGDGFSNRGESLAWTNPFSPHDKLELRVVADGSEIALEWNDVHGVAYALEASSDLANWSTVTSFEPHLPEPDTTPGSTSYQDSWAPWLGGGLDFDLIWGLSHGFFGSGGSEYLPHADPDLDGLSNLVESYADTDPFEDASVVTASLVHSRRHLRVQWFGDDGLLRYELEIPLTFEFYDYFDPRSTAWTVFGSAVDEYYGADPDQRLDEFRIRSFVAGETRVHSSANFQEEDLVAPGMAMDAAIPVRIDADSWVNDGTTYLWWTGVDGEEYVVRLRLRLGDWDWGRAGALTSHGSSPGGNFYRLSALEAEDPDVLTAVEWGALRTGQYADEDWDYDGIPNGWEAEHQLDPLDGDDGGEDPDGDVLSNYEEFLDGRHPHIGDVQKVAILLHNESLADPGWYLRRERWDLVDGWVDSVVFTPGDLADYIDHVFGERYRYTMVPGTEGGAVPDTEFIPLPHGDQPPYWQEETPSTQHYEQNTDGSFTLTSPGSSTTMTGTYPYPPNVFPVSSVRTFQLYRPHLNLPPCLLHNNNRDEYKNAADDDDVSLKMKDPVSGNQTGVLMFNDLMTGREPHPLLYLAPGADRLLKSPLTDYRLVRKPAPGETGELRFHALKHRENGKANSGKPLAVGLEAEMLHGVNLVPNFLKAGSSHFDYGHWVEGIEEGKITYHLEWRYGNVHHVTWAGETEVLPRQLAFSDALSVAEGFGKWSIGGRCGQVVEVTNTDDYKSGDPEIDGSLRWALTSKDIRGPKIIRFTNLTSDDNNGTIKLLAPLKITEPFVTIEGHTAPNMGVCLRDERVIINADHVIIRYLRGRPGDTTGSGQNPRYPLVGAGPRRGKDTGNDHDCFEISGARHVILDHCSASWGIDETISIGKHSYETDNVTLQWCLLSSGLEVSTHSKTHAGAGEHHGFGSLFQAARGAKYSIQNSMYAHIVRRNPRFGNKLVPAINGNADYGDTVGGFVDFRSNVIYNWGNYKREAAGINFDAKKDLFSRLHYNLVDNHYQRGNDTKAGVNLAMEEYTRTARGFFDGNMMNGALPASQWDLVKFVNLPVKNTPGKFPVVDQQIYKQQSAEFPSDEANTPVAASYGSPVSRTVAQITSSVGASQVRDPVDDTTINEFNQQTGNIINSQNQFQHANGNGWPQLPH